jgi:alkylation response protein AidB-like acyl-CoA dehydrogenase
MSEPGFDAETLRDGFRDVLARELTSERLHRFVDSGELRDEALWREAAALGWPALAIPDDHGGLGLGLAEAAVLFEELGRSLAPAPMLGAYLAGRAIALGGSPAQQAAWLPRIAAGEVVCAVSPPDPGRHPLPELAIEGDEVVLSGDAADLLDAGGADLLAVLARGQDGTPVYVLVESGEAEIEVERLVDRTRHLGRIRFDGLRLPADRRLAGGDALCETLIGEAALLVASDAKGGAEAVFERTLDYLKTRVQFGKPIGSFQALKHRCADHKVALEASGAVTAEAIRLWAADDPTASVMASSAKAYGCEVYATVAEDAVQLHGGIGYTWEHDCHLFLKRAKLDQALSGATAAHLDRAARLLAGA